MTAEFETPSIIKYLKSSPDKRFIFVSTEKVVYMFDNFLRLLWEDRITETYLTNPPHGDNFDIVDIVVGSSCCAVFIDDYKNGVESILVYDNMTRDPIMKDCYGEFSRSRTLPSYFSTMRSKGIMQIYEHSCCYFISHGGWKLHFYQLTKSTATIANFQHHDTFNHHGSHRLCKVTHSDKHTLIALSTLRVDTFEDHKPCIRFAHFGIKDTGTNTLNRNTGVIMIESIPNLLLQDVLDPQLENDFIIYTDTNKSHIFIQNIFQIGTVTKVSIHVNIHPSIKLCTSNNGILVPILSGGTILYNTNGNIEQTYLNIDIENDIVCLMNESIIIAKNNIITFIRRPKLYQTIVVKRLLSHFR